MTHYTLGVVQNSSAARATVDVGTVIADTYTVEALLGRGGMGSVFLASHNRLPGKKIAIKVLHPDLADEEVLARFKREAQIATQLDHPNIVRVDDFIMLPDGTPCMLLEYLQGETLSQRLRSGPLSLEQALSIVRQVGSALSAAHRAGIVHRDLKPQNIFLVPTEHDGHAAEVAKVLDFGISKIRGSQTVMTQESSLLGTPQYMAPEQATGQHTAVDERTDVFAFGAIVYEMLCGQPAFQGASIPEVVFKVVYEQPVPLTDLAKTLPTSVTDAITHAMEKKADRRFPNVNAFIEALTGQPISVFRKKVPLPDATLAAGSQHKKPLAEDAFAQTVGSGDHKDSIVPLPPPPKVSAIDATVASQNRDTIPQPVAPVMAEPPAKRTGLIIAVVVAGIAIAVAIFFATKQSGDEPKRDVVATVPGPTAVVPSPQVGSNPNPAVVVPPPDAAVAAVAPVAPVDAAVTAPVIEPKGSGARHPALPIGGEKPDARPHADETEAVALLAEAEAAFAAGNCPNAMRGALAVSRMQDPRPSQKWQAQGLLGSCACQAQNLDGANTAFRQAPNGTPAAARIVKACKAQGMTPSR